MAHNYGLLWLIYGLLYGIVACYFGLLGVPGSVQKENSVLELVHPQLLHAGPLPPAANGQRMAGFHSLFSFILAGEGGWACEGCLMSTKTALGFWS